MDVQNFFAHHRLAENPFAAEEARLDPVFDRLLDDSLTHPDFDKILGQLSEPGTSVVFGEKGSGKTAIRLMLERDIRNHNANNPDGRILLVGYDDLNPMLDHLRQAIGQDTDATLSQLRLQDHQDAILSLAVTRLVDAVLGEGADTLPLSDAIRKKIRKWPHRDRTDLAVMAAIYDRPHGTSGVGTRLAKTRKRLRSGVSMPLTIICNSAIGLSLLTLIFLGVYQFVADPHWWVLPLIGLMAAGAVGLWGWWGLRIAGLWKVSRGVVRDVRVLPHTHAAMRKVLSGFAPDDLSRLPLPTTKNQNKANDDSRYQLTRRLVELISPMGYRGMIVLVDRVDEPTAISGDPGRMRATVWPMFDNKFLQQRGVGLKLMLPIDLRHLLLRESPAFFQEARLDKQNLIDRLTWSGATLYDLCTRRLRACHKAATSEGDEQTTSFALVDLFAEDVNETMLVDALDQMHQPRDAFKFLYQVIQEHCRLSTDAQPSYEVARLTLESVRRAQSQRVQDLYRGLGPA